MIGIEDRDRAHVFVFCSHPLELAPEFLVLFGSLAQLLLNAFQRLDHDATRSGLARSNAYPASERLPWRCRCASSTRASPGCLRLSKAQATI